jgi:flavorubredoxin
MEIKIEDYLNHSEIKDVVIDELRNQIRKHFNNEENANRLLINLSYAIVKNEVDKIVPNHQEVLVKKVAEIINDSKSTEFCLFDFDSWGSGRNKSLGAKIIEETVAENKQLIKEKVIESITNKDYSEDAWNKFEALAESFTSNIYDFVDAMRNKNK